MMNVKNQVHRCGQVQWVLAITMLGIFVGFYFLGYRPETTHLHQLQGQILQQTFELRDSEAKTRVLPAVANDVKSLRQQLDQSKKLPPQQELPQFLKDVASLGQESSLHQFTIKPGILTRSDLFSELPISLSFDGDFVDVSNFLRRTEEMQRLTRIRNMTVKTADGKLGQVQVELSMNIYFSPDK